MLKCALFISVLLQWMGPYFTVHTDSLHWDDLCMVFSQLTAEAVLEGLCRSSGKHGEGCDRAVQPAGWLPKQKTHYDFSLHCQPHRGQKSEWHSESEREHVLWQLPNKSCGWAGAPISMSWVQSFPSLLEVSLCADTAVPSLAYGR